MASSGNTRNTGPVHRPLTSQNPRLSMASNSIPSSTSDVNKTGQSSSEPDSSRFGLDFEKYQSRMDSILARLNQNIIQDRKELVSDENEFVQKTTHNEEEKHRINLKAEEYEKLRENVAQELAELKRNITEHRKSIAIYTSRNEDTKEKGRATLNEIERIQNEIQQKENEHQRQEELLGKQIALINPECQFWEQTLGLRFDGGPDDVLEFVFTNIDADNFDRPFSCTLDLSSHDYKVVKCQPELSSEVLNRIISNLNKSRQLNVFLKQLWSAFKDYVAH